MRFRRKVRPAREVSKTDDEWKAELTAEQYRVLRKNGTERPFGGSNVHPDPDMVGLFRCAGCGAELFDAKTQFDSGTGWPSFSDADAATVERRRDLSMGIPRIEVICRRCGGHLGHVFGDGPGPAGQRYCINSCSVTPPAPKDSGDDVV